MAKSLIALVIPLLVSWQASAEETSIEKLCRLNLEAVKELVKLPLDDLKAAEEFTNSIASLSQYEEITGNKTGFMINTIKKYRKVSDQEVEAIVLKLFKDMELIKIQRAIELKPYFGKINWSLEHKKCIVASNATAQEVNSKPVKP
jgi:hypothetical protein